MEDEVMVPRKKRLIHEMWLRFVGFVKVFMSNPRAVMVWLAPVIFITLYQAGAVLLSNGLDQVLNPRLRKL